MRSERFRYNHEFRCAQVRIMHWLYLFLMLLPVSEAVRAVAAAEYFVYPTCTHPWPSSLGKSLAARGGVSSTDEALYSFSLTTFSPRGSLGQIEYASNAAQEGALAVAVEYDGGVALASVCKARSPLVVDVGTRKVAHVSDSIAMLYSGVAADSRVLTRKAQERCLRYQIKIGSNACIPVTTLVSELALVMQEYTQIAGVRPFGVALLVAGVQAEETFNRQGDSDNGEHEGKLPNRSQSRLYRVEPSGRYSRWKASAIGKGSAEAEVLLRKWWEEAMDRNTAIDLALSVLLRCSPADTKRENVEIAYVEEGNVEMVTHGK